MSTFFECHPPKMIWSMRCYPWEIHWLPWGGGRRIWGLPRTPTPRILPKMWGSPKMGVPQNGWFIRENPMKNGWQLRVPLWLRKPPCIQLWAGHYPSEFLQAGTAFQRCARWFFQPTGERSSGRGAPGPGFHWVAGKKIVATWISLEIDVFDGNIISHWWNFPLPCFISGCCPRSEGYPNSTVSWFEKNKPTISSQHVW